MTQQNGLSNLIEELRRRRVFRVAAFYGGIAFVIVQIIDGTFEVMGVPAWVSRLLIILMALGFPVSMILAWVFDITPDGIVRTKGRPVDAERKAQPLIGNRALAVIAVLAVAFGIWRGGSTPNVATEEASVAVLPFATFSSGVDDQYFADGMTDNLITQLYKVTGLKVIARTSVMHYKNTTKRMNEIGDELGVSTLLEGSIQRSANRVIITAQLIDVETEGHLWAESYNRNIEDLFEVQNEVASKIAKALKGKLSTKEEAALSYRPTDNLAAWEAYSKGLALYHLRSGDADGLNRIASEFERATAIDPTFLEAWAYQVISELLIYWFGYDISAEQMDKIELALSHANQLDPNHPMTLIALGRYHYHGFRDYARALQAFYRALDVAPGDREILSSIAYIERRVGQFESSADHLFQALEVDPMAPDIAGELANTLEALGRYKEVSELSRQALKQKGKFRSTYSDLLISTYYQTRNLEKTLGSVRPYRNSATIEAWEFYDGWIETELGSLDRAIELFEQGARKRPRKFGWQEYNSYLNYTRALFAAQRHDEVREILGPLISELDNLVDHPLHSGTFLAMRGEAYALLGETDLALADVDRAWEILPNTKDALDGNDIGLSRARAYMLAGDLQTAIDQWDTLLGYSQFELDVIMLTDFRTWEPLKAHPDFKKLVQKYSGGR